MIICSECGCPCDEQDVFCRVCGLRLKQAATGLDNTNAVHCYRVIGGKTEEHIRLTYTKTGTRAFAEIWIRFEPQTEQDGLLFCEEIFGGAIPMRFFPVIENTLISNCNSVLSVPIFGLKATLVDGSYHPKDSNAIAFSEAAGEALSCAIDKLELQPE